MLHQATPDTLEIARRWRALLLEVVAHPAEKALVGVNRSQPVARRLHQRQEAPITVGHLLRQVLERIGRGEQAGGGRPETSSSRLGRVPQRSSDPSIVGNPLARRCMPGGRRGQHNDQRDSNATWCLHPTIPLLDSAAGLQPFLPGDQINALNQRRLLALGH